MTERLRHLKLAAVNIDGVLLTDTFSPLIHQFITGHGGRYSADVERRIFSQPQAIAGQAMADAVPQPMSGQQALEAYFAERETYLVEHPVQTVTGAAALLHRLRAAGLRTVCYGGLDKSHFDQHLGDYAVFFDDPVYICTNDIRPGIHEITQHFGVRHGEALFIDDVARVAEEAKRLGTAFVGHPSQYEHCHQAQLMQQAGVRHVVGFLGEIDAALLAALDREAAAGTVWSTDRTPPTLAAAAS